MEKLTKKEKTLIGIFLAIPVISELIYGIATKYWFYSLFGTWSQVKEKVAFIASPENAKFYFFILFFEMVSFLILLFLLIKFRSKIRFSLILSVVVSVIILAVAYVLLFSYFAAFGSIQMTI